MQKKSNLYPVLMVSSILVLLTLQFLWLSSVYRDYRTNLKQETSLLFKQTVTEMMDSLVVRGLSPVILPFGNADTLSPVIGQRFMLTDSIKTIHIEMKVGDSLPENLRELKPSQIRHIHVTSAFGEAHIDSLVKGRLRTVVQRVDTAAHDQRFVLRLQDDRLEPEQIRERFGEVLRENGYPFDVQLQKAERNRGFDSIPPNAFVLEETAVFMGTRLRPYFESLEGYFFRKMLPPSLFAILVIALINISFYVLYRNMRKQEQLNLIKNDIISNITHELKTPVATISVVLESLQHFGAEEDARTKEEYIQIAQNELKRLITMADSILKSSSVGNEKETVLNPVDLEQVVQDAIVPVKPVLDAKGFAFHLEKKGKDFTIRGNPKQLSLVLFNLLDNAIKYSKEKRSIRVTLKEEGGQVTLQVADEGIGIPEPYQKDIFEKFIRVPQEDVHDVKGYGLGLAQVAEIVQAHQGKIHLESHPGKGSVFTVQLPKA